MYITISNRHEGRLDPRPFHFRGGEYCNIPNKQVLNKQVCSLQHSLSSDQIVELRSEPGIHNARCMPLRAPSCLRTIKFIDLGPIYVQPMRSVTRTSSRSTYILATAEDVIHVNSLALACLKAWVQWDATLHGHQNLKPDAQRPIAHNTFWTRASLTGRC